VHFSWQVAALGAAFLSLFLLIRLGLYKSWFVTKTLPGHISARMFYSTFPLGIEFLFWSILPILPGYDNRNWDIWDAVFFILLLLPLYFLWRPPQWVVPAWVKWIEKEYGYCLDILAEEGQQMGRWEWESQVRTQEGMQVWIDDVFARRRKDIDERWKHVKVYLNQQHWLQKSGGKVVKPGTLSPEYVPQHRLNDCEVTEEESIEVVKLWNRPYLKAETMRNSNKSKS
jgi:hypothetical protein